MLVVIAHNWADRFNLTASTSCQESWTNSSHSCNVLTGWEKVKSALFPKTPNSRNLKFWILALLILYYGTARTDLVANFVELGQVETWSGVISHERAECFNLLNKFFRDRQHLHHLNCWSDPCLTCTIGFKRGDWRFKDSRNNCYHNYTSSTSPT